MRQTRPTAVNLFWAVDRMKRILDQVHAYGVEEDKAKLEEEALRIYEEDVEVNQKIGEIWEEAYQRWGWSAHPLQCRCFGHGWLWNSAGSDLCGLG